MSKKSKTQKNWIIFILIFGIVLYGFIIVDLFRTQLGINTKSERYSFIPRVYSNTVPCVRGNILDRNLNNPTILALSKPQWTVFLDPSMISTNTSDEVLFDTLNNWGELPTERINIGLNKNRKSKYYILGKTTNRDFVDFLKTNNVTRLCIGFEKSQIRQYPLGDFLNPVLGIVNSHEEALLGIEYEYDEYLSGKPGYIIGIADARRKELRSFRKTEIKPENGNDIYLTISTQIQKFAEDALLEAMATNNAKRGWIIVQRPYTGEILAMASAPTFTRENYGEESEELRRNFATCWNYEPGSIMKAMIFSLGLNENLYQTNSVFDTTPRLYFGRPLQDHVGNEETYASALAKSSNRVSSQIAMATTKERSYQYIKAFGFGEKTGVVKKGEEKGILPNYKKWSNLQHIRIAIGQGISVTPIQMIGMYSTIANGGVRMQPQLIREIRAPDGTVIFKNKPKPIGRVISEKTAKTISELLIGVTTQGTGRRAKIPGYTVAGKTGTAQKSIPGGYSTTDYTGSFVGFFPAEDPEITILVGFDTPLPKYQGGTVAAPVFSALGKKISDYLNIPTNNDTSHNVYNYIDMNK